MSFSEKLSLAAGSATLALTPAVADAGLVTVDPAPGTIKLSFSQAAGTTVAWDVDGVGTQEFGLKLTKNPGPTTVSTEIALNSRSYVAYGVYNEFNGRGFVGKPFVTATYGGSYAVDRAHVLGASFNVGPTLAAPNIWGLSQVNDNREMLLRVNDPYSNFFSAQGLVDAASNPVGTGNYFIGFRFDPGDGLHYGWAEINIDLLAESFEILRWTYNDIASTPVHIADVAAPPPPTPIPEVSALATMLPGLVLLGFGASGVRTLRKRRAAKTADNS